jgi:hypothetical protein
VKSFDITRVDKLVSFLEKDLCFFWELDCLVRFVHMDWTLIATVQP